MSRLSLFPFDDAMAFGFGILHLAPAEFWTMTPRELRQALKPHLPQRMGPAITRARLDELMRNFPDLPHTMEFDDARSLS